MKYRIESFENKDFKNGKFANHARAFKSKSIQALENKLMFTEIGKN